MKVLMGGMHYARQNDRLKAADVTRIMNNLDIWLEQAITVELNQAEIDKAIEWLVAIEAAFPGADVNPFRERLRQFANQGGFKTALTTRADDGRTLTEQELRHACEQEALAGKPVLRYRKNLGQGNFGEVACVEIGNQIRAQKMNKKINTEEKWLMENERQKMSRLNHPHIIRETGGVPVDTAMKVTKEWDVENDFVLVESVEDGLAGIQTELASGSLDLKDDLWKKNVIE